MNNSGLPSSELLHSRGPEQMALHERASEAAMARFGRKVFVRGVVELSNYCRQDCHYCGMRRDNRGLKRFRAQYEQFARLLIEERPPSVTDINLQAGEDPVAVREIALPLLRTLKRETALGLSVCLGSLNPNLYAELKQSGARIYIIKFETSRPEHYQRLQAPGTLDKRLANIRHLALTGWSVSSGFIAGLPGQTDRDLKSAFALADDLPLSGCSVSPFIPGEETPLSKASMGNIDLTLNCMALLRLIRPDWVIPSVSALNLAEPELGYRRGLRTGANLVTINLTPTQIRGDYLLYKRDRFIMTEERILSAIAAEGLEPSRESLAEHYDVSNIDGKDTTTVMEPEEPEFAKTK